MKDTVKRLVVTFRTDSLHVFEDEDDVLTTVSTIGTGSHPGFLTTWGEGRLAVGGLLGEIKQ